MTRWQARRWPTEPRRARVRPWLEALLLFALVMLAGVDDVRL